MTAAQQIERAIHKVADKFPENNESVLTDIHLQVKPSSGEILAYDDDDNELTRCVVEQWIGSNDDFYEEATSQIVSVLERLRSDVIDKMSIMHPFSFVLIDEEGETVRDFYLVDDDAVIVSGGLLEGLDEDLNAFLKELLG